jgi:hypothetical protein
MKSISIMCRILFSLKTDTSGSSGFYRDAGNHYNTSWHIHTTAIWAKKRLVCNILICSKLAEVKKIRLIAAVS